MNKDFEPSKKYTEEELMQINIPYRLNDSCVDYFYEYKICELKFNKIKTRFLNSCSKERRIWKNCQNQREEELQIKLKMMEKKLNK